MSFMGGQCCLRAVFSAPSRASEPSRATTSSSTGTFLFQWGTKSSGPGEFDLPHGLALDHTGRIYVADRSNLRVQIFDGSGHYVGEWKGKDIGRPYGIAFASNGTAFVAD